jgi:hypothetical protein
MRSKWRVPVLVIGVIVGLLSALLLAAALIPRPDPLVERSVIPATVFIRP